MSDYDPEIEDFDEDELRDQEELGDETPRKKMPWEKFSDDIEKEKQDLKDKLGETFDKHGIDKDTDIGSGEGLYKGKGKKEVSANRKKRRRMAIAASSGILGIVGGIIGLFGFFANFKLDFLLDNLDAAAFTKINATFDGRSDRWIRKYVQVRLSEFNGESEPGETFFRSTGVDTGHPFRDWYRTMRTNNFMDDLLQKNGITLVNRSSAQGLPSFTVMRVNGEDFGHDPENFRNILNNQDPRLSEILRNGDVLADVDLNRPGANKEARKIIKNIVHKETRFYNVIQRRHTRKAFQNVTGIRDWRFFETTRDRVSAKSLEIKSKFFQKVFPDPGVYAKAFGCLFGFSPCPKTTDPGSSDARATGSADGDGLTDGDDPENRPIDTDGDGVPDVDPNTGATGTIDPNTGRVDDAASGATEALRETFDPESPSPLGGRQEALERLLGKYAGKFVGKVLEKFNIITTVVSFASAMRTISTIHENIESGDVDKIAQISKGASASQAYTTLKIIQDQVKARDLAGKIELTEDQRLSLEVDASEVFQLDDMMQMLAGAERSDGFAAITHGFTENVANAQNISSAAREEFCNPEHRPHAGEWAFICNGMRIGGKSPLRAYYETSVIGDIMGAISSFWNGLESIPGVSWLVSVSDGISERLSNALMGIVGKFVDINAFMNSIMEKVIAYMAPILGLVPMITDNSNGGNIYNAAVQGAGYGAEAQMRVAGGVKAEEGSAAYEYGQQLAANYLSEKYEDMSIYDKYLSLDNMGSVASRTLFSTITTLEDFSFTKSLTSNGFFGTLGNSLMDLFSGRSFATIAGSPQELADITTYAPTQQCMELDPTENDPQDYTNADSVFPSMREDLTWQLMGDEESWFEALYEEAGDDRSKVEAVETIYNCVLLDNQVRGGLGYLGGYDSDGGLVSSSPTTTPRSSSNGNIYLLGDSLTVGMRASGSLPNQLRDAGWTTSFISAKCGRSLTLRGNFSSCNAGEGTDSTALQALDQIEEGIDQNAIRSAGTIVIGLGTNDFGVVSQGEAGLNRFRTAMEAIVTRIRTINPNNPTIYWTNLYSSIDGSCTATMPTNDCMITLNSVISESAELLDVSVINWAGAAEPYYPAGGNIHPSDYEAMAEFITTAVGAP